MADILIRGMEMPKDGHCIVRIYASGDICEPTPCAGVWSKVAEAIPLPEGHGRLGDLDALLINLMDRGIEGLQTDDWHEVQQTIADALTIVPAEGGNKT